MLFTVISPHLHQADFTPGLLGLEISTSTAESGWGLGFVNSISFFIFGSGIVLDLFLLYLCVSASFPQQL
jgi:hypothetical protein